MMFYILNTIPNVMFLLLIIGVISCLFFITVNLWNKSVIGIYRLDFVFIYSFQKTYLQNSTFVVTTTQ